MHNTRASRIIFIGIAAFVAILAALLVMRGRGTAPAPAEPISMRADYRIKEIHLTEETGKGVKWTLEADQAEAYEDLGRTILRKVRLRVDQPGRSWTVTGEEGELHHTSKDVDLRGDVVLLSTDGLRLRTDRLRWFAAEQRARTDVAVTIERPGLVVRGTGLEARVADQAAEIKGPVRATFQPAGSDAGPQRAPGPRG